MSALYKNSLSRNDIEILIEALSAWERAPLTDDAMTSLLAIMLAPDKEARDKMMAEDRDSTIRTRQQQQGRSEAVVRMKAKLFDMRDTMEGQEQ